MNTPTLEITGIIAKIKTKSRMSNGKEYVSTSVFLEFDDRRTYKGETQGKINYVEMPFSEYYWNKKSCHEPQRGQTVTIQFKFDGFEYEKDGKRNYFTSVKCIEMFYRDNAGIATTVSAPVTAKPVQTSILPETKKPVEDTSYLSDDDDLPF